MRKSGILMHISSLPSPYGIGTFGHAAYEFVDFLKASGQRCWQILPLGHTGFGNSPYQTFSAFAGNPYFIDLEFLEEDGLLTPGEAAKLHWGENEEKTDYAILEKQRFSLLRKAYSRFLSLKTGDFVSFLEDNADWVFDYALFMSLKEHYGGKPFWQWDEDIKHRRRKALVKYSSLLEGSIGFYCFLQYLFFDQWQDLKDYANENGIEIIGDMPIYVSRDSADVWCAPENYQLGEDLSPTVVAGCPPDAFSETGQLWGNPIYDWQAMEKDGFSWWVQRIKAASRLFDLIRLDHFRGLESYWAIPYGDETAQGGKWIKGPGKAFIDCIREKCPEAAFIAEDLGDITPRVRELLDYSGYPGMKVLAFAFSAAEESSYLPHLYDDANCVCYTGTHDNATAKQNFAQMSDDDLAFAMDYLDADAENLVGRIITAGMESRAMLFIAPIQDYLELGREGRMNLPGTLSEDNWNWRVKNGSLSPALAEKIRRITEKSGRI